MMCPSDKLISALIYATAAYVLLGMTFGAWSWLFVLPECVPNWPHKCGNVVAPIFGRIIVIGVGLIGIKDPLQLYDWVIEFAGDIIEWTRK